ncbi:two-component system chemotaxis response regulator CheB [Rhizobium sp. BK650]|uniref:chemotaxis protein CheB n=1 Tax=Rhizobium sp. BK650 TaxID=2586990 RepID=UPI00161CE7EC|nr:chemotaxis protein CheB [Rhizobium sp. BK650]MBB3660748.1 two-component system chemotaxis response regulator CheB [Rhizobium sp. BK650]
MMAIEPEAVVIGASAGALEALSVILPALPRNFRLPILVVVHVPPDKRSVLADVFRAKCQLHVEEAEDKAPLAAGTIYFAPPDYHLLVELDKSVSLSSDEPVLFSRPSIDVLFESAADAYGPALIAIVLTGANHDGAKGLQAVAEADGITLVQDPGTAFAPTMPEAAIQICPSARIMSLEALAKYLNEV